MKKNMKKELLKTRELIDKIIDKKKGKRVKLKKQPKETIRIENDGNNEEFIKKIKNLASNPSIALYAVLIFSLIFFIVRPTVIGYSTYQEIKDTDYSVETYGEGLEKLRNDINGLNTQLQVVETDHSSCSEFNERLFGELNVFKQDLSECKKDLGNSNTLLELTKDRYETQIDSIKASHVDATDDLEDHYGEEISELRTQLNNKEQELNSLKNSQRESVDQVQDDFNELAQNAADNICCKHKVDNPNIKAYVVQNNRIVCLEEGSLFLTC